MKHTDGPWTYDGLGIVMGVRQKVAGGYGHREPVCTMNNALPEAPANAEFIVRACNAYDDLLAALKELCAVPNKHRPFRVWDDAHRAIAKATGGES